MNLRTEYLRRTNREGHWFDKDTMKSFSTIIEEIRTIEGDPQGDVFFLSAECPTGGSYRYTVRYMDADGDIWNLGPFCELSRSEAEKLLNETADDAQRVFDEAQERGQG